MPISRSLNITVYDSDFNRTGFVGNPINAQFVVRRNGMTTGTLVVDSDHPYVDALSDTGARIVANYVPAADASPKIISGALTQVGGQFGAAPTRTYAVSGYFSLFSQILAWPRPNQAITDQGLDDSGSGSSTTPGAYYTATGPAEQVVKAVLQANIQRLGMTNVVVAPVPQTGARGATITASFRMDALADKLFPLATQAGLVVTAEQSGSQIVVDVHAPATYPLPLSEITGVITDGSWSRADPTATRAIVGGIGEGANRDFVSVADASLESDWGRLVEVFVDGSDAGSTYSELLNSSSSTAQQKAAARTAYLAALQQKGLDAISAGAPSYQMSLVLADTEVFAYGLTYDVGDIVKVQLDSQNVATDAVTAVTLTYGAETGLTVAPTVGDGTDAVGQLAQAIASVAKTQRIASSAR